MTAPTQDALDGPPCVDAFACEAPAVARALAVDPASGLTEDEAVRRRARVGQHRADRTTALARALRGGRAARDDDPRLAGRGRAHGRHRRLHRLRGDPPRHRRQHHGRRRPGAARRRRGAGAHDLGRADLHGGARKRAASDRSGRARPGRRPARGRGRCRRRRRACARMPRAAGRRGPADRGVRAVRPARAAAVPPRCAGRRTDHDAARRDVGRARHGPRGGGGHRRGVAARDASPGCCTSTRPPPRHCSDGSQRWVDGCRCW